VSAPARDYEPWEIASAIVIAFCVQVGTVTVMYLSKITDRACQKTDEPVCAVGEKAECILGHWECKQVDTPDDSMKVMPVLDMEAVALAKLGGKKAVLPEMWDRAPESVKKKIQEQPPVVPEDVAAPSVKAKATDEIPDASKVATIDAAGEGPPDSEVAETPTTDAAPQEGADAGQESSTTDAGIATLDPDGGTSNTGGPGCQGAGCDKDGGADDFIAAQYVGRLIGFFKRGFVVSGLGLPPDEIKKLSVSVSVTLSDDGTVTSFNMGSSGNATFDAAARSAMQGKVGQQVPPPPEDKPNLKRTSLSFSMTCSSACN